MSKPNLSPRELTFARKFLRAKFSPDAEFRPIHLSLESLALLLAEYEESLPPMFGNSEYN